MHLKLSLAVALATEALADLTCIDLTPKNWTSSLAKVNVSSGTEVGSIFDRPDLLPTYAGVENPWKLRYKKNPGAKFSLKTCNSTSLGLSSYIQSSCSHGGCYHSYYDYVQIINPYTGHCLATKTWNASATDLNFVQCDSNAQNTSQLWEANQYVFYPLGYGNPSSYADVTLNPIQRGTEGNLIPPYFAWDISKDDNKTIQVVHFDYTQKGVFLDLLQF